MTHIITAAIATGALVLLAWVALDVLLVGIAGGVVLVALIFLAAGWADLGQYGEPDQ